LRPFLDQPSFFCYKTIRAMATAHPTPSTIESRDVETTMSARALQGAFFYATYRAWRFS
jgi:hypothetical protein